MAIKVCIGVAILQSFWNASAMSEGLFAVACVAYAVERLLATRKVAGSNLEFGTGQWAVTLFSWEGNRRPGGK